MTVHEVVYFNGAGRAEAIRVCLYIASQTKDSDVAVAWMDTRIEGKDWPALKPTTPLGSLPLLKVDGFTHVQSLSLARYAAKLAGLYPSDPLQALYVDEVMDTINDLISATPMSKDEEEKKQLREEFAANKMKQYVDFIESTIQHNTGGNGVVTTPSVADLILQNVVSMIHEGHFDYIDKTYFDSYPGIMATTESISNHDGVKAYYASLGK
jgi:prostaglandin-H2 D-isomerase / glutathione transferase